MKFKWKLPLLKYDSKGELQVKYILVEMEEVTL